MYTTSLKPIDSNLRRIKTAFGGSKSMELKAIGPLEKKRSRAFTLEERLQELHVALLGTMVSVQSLPPGVEIKAFLQILRPQIVTFRQIKEALEAAPLYNNRQIRETCRLVLIAFYDLEGLMRKRSASASSKSSSQSSLVAAIAEKSKTAVALALSKEE